MNIFISNLSRNVRADDLRKLFNGFGTVLEAKLASDAGKESSGYANVHIVPDDAAREAIAELDLAPLKGSPIRLRECVFRASGERRVNKRMWRDADNRRRHAERRREPDVARLPAR
jgi:RNA recognition motif-containing protein